MKLVFGLIPCLNMQWLNLVWDVIKPGVDEIAAMSYGEYTTMSVFQNIYFGTFNLHMAYLDTENTPDDQMQKALVSKLVTPQNDFVAFAVTQMLSTSFHVFQGYIDPQYRNKETFELCSNYLEQQARKINAPYITVATKPSSLDMTKAGFKDTYTMFRKKL